MNTFSLDLADNAELKAALAGAEPGDRVTLEVTLMVTEANEQRFEGDIESISVDTMSEEDGEASEPVEPDVEAPVMIVLGVGKSKKMAADDEGDA